jgi:ABC-type transporter Mla MlaB component
MLRITPALDGLRPCLRLEGRLVGPWVAELASAVEQHAPTMPALDLAKLQFVDGPGLDLLGALQRRGAALVAASPFVAQLLQSHPE